MINYIIRFIKRNPFLYNLAKRVNGILSRNKKAPVRETELIFYGFVLTDFNQLEEFKAKYEKIKRFDTKLFILINNPSYNILMHRIIRENPDICFSSFDYFKRYGAKMTNHRITWLNLTAEDGEILNCLV